MSSRPPDWHRIQLGAVAKVQGGYAFKSSSFTEKGIPIVRMSNLKRGRLSLGGAARVPREVVKPLQQFRLNTGDLLLGLTGSIENYAVVYEPDLPCYLNQRVGRFRQNDSSRLYYPYLRHLIQAPSFKESLHKLAGGVAQLNVSPKKMEGIEFLLPSLPEQRKIAAFLSSVDDTIEKTEAVIEQLQVVKKAMMQELLTRGLPGRHTRFKKTEIGEVPSEWEVVPLVEACEFLDGQRVPIKASDRKKMCGDIPYYGASGVIGYVNRHIFDEDLILLAEDGANILTRSYPVAFRVTGRCWVNNHAHVLRPRSGWDHDFLVEYLESLDYSNYSTGTAQPKLNQRVCQSIAVAAPSKEEQNAIGRLACSIHSQLRSEVSVLDALNKTKSALMSVLLTGEVRVTPAEAIP